MNAATLGIASDFVKSGIAKAGIPLTQTLEAYLSITFARFIGATISRRPADGARHPGDRRQRAARRAARPRRRMPDRLRLLRGGGCGATARSATTSGSAR